MPPSDAEDNNSDLFPPSDMFLFFVCLFFFSLLEENLQDNQLHLCHLSMMNIMSHPSYHSLSRLQQ